MSARERAFQVVAVLIAALPGVLFAAAPDNDAFGSPVVLTDFPVTVVGSNVGATLEPAEPVPSSAAEGSVWFSWTAPIGGMVQIDTLRSDFDTWLAVWTGDSLTALTLVAENDDFAGLQSGVFVNVTEGVTYRIAVYGFSSARGRIVLNLKADVTSRITGRVTGPDGTTPLEGVQATAYQWRGDWWQQVNSGQTDANGDYTIGGLPAGTYRVEFRDWWIGEHVPMVYDNASDLDSGTDIIVPADTTVTGIDASMALGARIAGRVTGPDGTTPLEGIQAIAYQWRGDWWQQVNGRQTDANGDYSIGGLPAGTYRVQFRDWVTGEHAPMVYDNAPDLDSGTDIIVPADTTVSGIDASMALGARITGRVTGQDGMTPLEAISITVYEWEGSWWRWVGWGQSGAEGHYTVGGLVAGTYRVQFQDWSNDELVSVVYENAPDLDRGTDIIVRTGATVTGIDASLAGRSTITGTVTGPDGTTPLEGIEVSAYQSSDSWLGWRELSWGVTDENGHYTIEGLTGGTYRVGFGDWWNGEYAPEAYNSAPDLDQAADIVVPAGGTVTRIDASLNPGSTITGTVTGLDGTARLANITVSAYRWGGSLVGWQAMGWGRTDTNGHYSIGGLAAGTYHVEFRDWWNGEYATQVYDNAPDLDSGAQILVPATTTVTGIDARLENHGLVAPPVIVGIRRTEGDGGEILYTGTSGATYVLQETSSLTSAWNDVGAPFVCQPGTNAISGERSGPILFWRIKQTTP
jgi:5-hydroxyisourate hydrolase-like protein (transthyretin family)